MCENKYECLSNWLNNYPALYNWLHFNASKMEAENVSLNSVSGERKLEEYIDGSYKAELYFALILVKPFDFETSETNMQAMLEIVNFMDWVDNKENIDLLYFGSDVIVDKVDVLQSSPNMVIDTEQSLAKYQFQAKVTYIQNV